MYKYDVSIWFYFTCYAMV